MADAKVENGHVTITDPGTGEQGTMPENVNNGLNGQGEHITEGNGATEDITRALVPGLVKDVFDEKVVKMGFTTGQMNAMTRDMGYRPTRAMEYGYYSIDIRKIKDSLASAVTVTKENAGRTIPTRAEITVANNTIFDVTDVIYFRDVPGYDALGNELPYVSLCARVCSVAESGNKLSVQFLNANPQGGQSVPEGTDIYILGHCASETDASTTPYAALPNKQTQFMQKFMVQSLISQVMEENTKEVNWGEADINEILLEQFIEDIEKAYVFGVKSYAFDPVKKLYYRTTSGIIEQMMVGGSKVITLYKDDLEYKDFLDAVNATFTENTGSPKRYMFNGCNVAPSIWGIKDVTKMVNVKEFKDCFGYDFSGFDLLGYSLVHVPYPLLDRMNRKDWSLVLDRQYVERRVFRSLEEVVLELKKTGTYDGKSTVWSEISSIILKYPQVHALWIFKDGKKPAPSTN